MSMTSEAFLELQECAESIWANSLGGPRAPQLGTWFEIAARIEDEMKDRNPYFAKLGYNAKILWTYVPSRKDRVDLIWGSLNWEELGS